jgi:hypothetical protein
MGIGKLTGRVEIRPSLRRCLSVRGGWQLAQLRFELVEIDGFGEEIGGTQFIGAAARSSSP